MARARLSEVAIRNGDFAIILSRRRKVAEIRRLEAPGSISNRPHSRRVLGTVVCFPLDGAERVELFVHGPDHRKVLRLSGRVGLDLGTALTAHQALAEARQVANLVERNLEIVLIDYRDAYFADSAPVLHAYPEDEVLVTSTPTLPVFHSVYVPVPPVFTDEDPTDLDISAVEREGPIDVSDLWMPEVA